MKIFLIIANLVFAIVAVHAQIGEVKKDGNLLRIFDEKGNNTGSYVSLCSNCELNGYNSEYIVVTDGNLARIYNDRGNNTGSYVNLCKGCYVKNVTKSAILVKEGNLVRYYNFQGNYMYYTYDQ